MSGLKTAEDYERACRVAKEVIDGWDPYSLLSGGAPCDEYEGEAASLVRHVPGMNSSEDATRAVSQVFSESFGAEDFQPDRCREVGARLFAALAEARLLNVSKDHR